MDSREAFEAWVTGRTVVRKYGSKLITRVDGSYADYRINDRWLAWCAALAAKPVIRDSLIAEPSGSSGELSNSSNSSKGSDAERLDWLEQEAQRSPTGVSLDYAKHTEDGYVTERGFRFMRRHFLGERKPTIREAIDAARAQRATAQGEE